MVAAKKPAAGRDKKLKYLDGPKKGKYWYFRHPAVGRVALPGAPGEGPFLRKYAELIELIGKPAGSVDRGSFAWLIRKYERSVEFKSLADATQKDYSNTLRLIDEELGDQQYRFTTRAMIKAVRDDHAANTRKAHKIKQMVSRLYSWADENSLVPEGLNPAKGIKELKPKGGKKQYVVWSDAEVELFLSLCPPHLVTPVMIALYTGQRREDIVRMTWQQFQGGVVRVRQSKTGAMLDIACHTALRNHLEQLRRSARGVVVCTTVTGKAFTANSLSQAIRQALYGMKEMPNDRSIHGLRYAAGSRMEEAGCTVAEIESVLGHSTFKMAMKYASQRIAARSAVEKMEGVRGA